MQIIDCQVHTYERDHPDRPWHAVLHGPPEVTGDDMVAAMDRVGVDGALLVSPFTMYRYDASYALEVYAQHPTRFGLIKPLDPTDPEIADVVTDWAQTSGAVAVRLMLTRGLPEDPGFAGYTAIASTAARHGLPVNVLGTGVLERVDQLASANRDTQFVLDHLGLKQPFEPPPLENPFADLAKVLELARHPNLAIKISGACTLSREAYPFNDIWDPLMRIFDAYGLDRCIWGTDWTRATELITYEQGVEPFRTTDKLSDSDREMLMGGALRNIYKWAPSG